MTKPMVLPVFTAAAAAIWNLKEKVLINEEEPGIYVFQFKNRQERDRLLGGGPWFFNGSMILLAEYDRLRPLKEISLRLLEVWVSVVGLRFAMRNEKVLTRIGNDLGNFVLVDPKTVQMKKKIQRVRVLMDVRQRIPAGRVFDYSSEISVDLEFTREKCNGICRECVFFGHGGGLCDKGGWPMEIATSTEAAVVVKGATEPPENGLLRSDDGLAMEEERRAMISADLGVEMGGKVAVEETVVAPVFSAGNPSLKLGLTELGAKLAVSELTELRLSFGPAFGVCEGIVHSRLKRKEEDCKLRSKNKNKDVTLDLVTCKRKIGRPLGSKNKKPRLEKQSEEPSSISFVPLPAPPNPSLKGKERDCLGYRLICGDMRAEMCSEGGTCT
ncbi:hypothetical protein ACLB2K_035980 [Fragaria x ananassa]